MLSFRAAADLWPLVDRAFQFHSRTIRNAVPAAHVDHVGATAVPDALTKGDLDLLVRVPEDSFADVIDALGCIYHVALADNWTPEYAIFSSTGDELPVRIQLVVDGSRTASRFLRLRRLLRSRPDLVDRANTLKRRYEGGDRISYSGAQKALYDELLGSDPTGA